jgi:hypothetical protein
MSYRDEQREANRIFERVRDKFNPNWREQHRRHLKQLYIGPETEGMSAKDIIARAMRLDGFEPRKKRYRQHDTR